MVMAEGEEENEDVITMEQAMEQLGIELKDNQFVSALDRALNEDNEIIPGGGGDGGIVEKEERKLIEEM